jgi:hypothetical protein
MTKAPISRVTLADFAFDHAVQERAAFDDLFVKLLADHGPNEALAMVMLWIADAADDIAFAKQVKAA